MLASVTELTEGGQSLSKTAWTVALGFAIGMFPLMGVTTLACVLIASVLRLKQASIQLGNYAALPLQIILLIPFLRLGERITGGTRFVFDPQALLNGFPHVPESTMRAVVMAQWHMIEGWALIAPIALVLAGLIAQAWLRRRERVRITDERQGRALRGPGYKRAQ
jgi:hypothetical protein